MSEPEVGGMRSERSEQKCFWFVYPNVTEHLSEAGVDILALHRLNLYPFIIVLYKYIYLLHYLSPSVMRGAPFPVGPLSTCLVCLWVNPELI